MKLLDRILEYYRIKKNEKIVTIGYCKNCNKGIENVFIYKGNSIYEEIEERENEIIEHVLEIINNN